MATWSRSAERIVLSCLVGIVATESEEEAHALVEAVRTTQWRVIRDDRRTHFDLLRLQAEARAERHAEQAALLKRLEQMLAAVRVRLPIARQLPAEIAEFVDRSIELAEAHAVLDAPPKDQTAVLLCCSGMPGAGKSTLALRVAHTHAGQFEGGILHVDMRGADGAPRPPADIAARVLRDLGVDPQSMPADTDATLALLRSVLAQEAVLMVLDNAENEAQLRGLIPANPDSVVIVTSRQPLGGLGGCYLLEVDELAEADGLDLLRAFLGDRVDAEPNSAEVIARACQGLPLALAVVAARLRRTPNRPLAQIADSLQAGTDVLRALDDREAAIRSALRSSLASLSDGAARLLMLVGVLEVTDIELSLTAALMDRPAVEVDTLIEELEVQRLIRSVPGGGFRVHDLVRAAARAQAGESLDEDDLASAQRRRVVWLVQAGTHQIDELGEAE